MVNISQGNPNMEKETFKFTSLTKKKLFTSDETKILLPALKVY